MLKVIQSCVHCGVSYESRPCDQRRFCSQSCARASQKRGITQHVLLCVYCNNTFTHSEPRTQYCSYNCYHSARRQQVLCICQVCGKQYSVQKNRADSKYCSRACFGVDQRKSVELLCAHCGTRYTSSLERVNVSKYCSPTCYQEAQQERTEQRCDNCGQMYMVTLSELKKGSRFCSRICWKRFNGETSIEKMVRLALLELDIAFEQEKHLGRFHIDFYLPECNIALEVDGAFWHNKLKAILRDTRRDAWMLSQGIFTVRIKEKDLKNGDPLRVVGLSIRDAIQQIKKSAV